MDKNEIFFIAVIVCLGLFLSNISNADDLKIGAEVPFFKVKSGDGQVLSLEMIKGKVTVIFYETKDVVEKNRKLKNELNKFYNQQTNSVKKSIIRLPVIDCSKAFWPFTYIWKSKLKESSKKEGITIYGDWDGKMKGSYKMKNKESNMIIIDKKGIIQYITSEKIKDKEIYKIKKLLKELTMQN